MTLKEYREKREGLMNEAQKLLESGDLEAVKAKKKEVEELDARFDAEKEAQADLDALKDQAPIVPPVVRNETKMGEETNEMNVQYNAASPEYRNAFLKHLLGQDDQMTKLENAAFVQTTSNTTAPLPSTMLDKIWDLVSTEHCIMGDITMYRTGTILEVVKHTAVVQGAAAVVNENAQNDDEKNTFVKVTLNGKDFSKHVDISYAAAKMSVDALEAYLENEIASSMGAAMATDVVTTIESQIAAANKVTGAAAKVTYSELAELFGKLKRAKNPVVYLTRATLFGQLVSMVDTTKRPIFQPSMQAGEQGMLLGARIKIEDAVGDGKILVGDPVKIVYNMVQDIMLETDKDIKKHVYTYSAYARGEGALIDDMAFAEWTAGAAASGSGSGT